MVDPIILPVCATLSTPILHSAVKAALKLYHPKPLGQILREAQDNLTAVLDIIESLPETGAKAEAEELFVRYKGFQIHYKKIAAEGVAVDSTALSWIRPAHRDIRARAAKLVEKTAWLRDNAIQTSNGIRSSRKSRQLGINDDAQPDDSTPPDAGAQQPPSPPDPTVQQPSSPPDHAVQQLPSPPGLVASSGSSSQSSDRSSNAGLVRRIDPAPPSVGSNDHELTVLNELSRGSVAAE